MAHNSQNPFTLWKWIDNPTYTIITNKHTQQIQVGLQKLCKYSFLWFLHKNHDMYSKWVQDLFDGVAFHHL
jgi:hypothetical protein